MYEIRQRVRFSEVGSSGRITLPGMINYFQDSSIFQSEELGIGTAYLKEKQRAWVLSSWQVEIKEYPRLGDRITVATWASGFKGFFGERNFVMRNEAGEDIAAANSIWVYIDTKSGHPVRPDGQEIEKYSAEPPYPMEYMSRKVPMPKDGTAYPPFPVRKYHIDTNGHVNNCQYVQMAVEALAETKGDLVFAGMRAEYKKSAVYGDVICPVIKENEDGSVITAGLCDQDGKPYAVIELKNKGEKE